MAIVLDSKEGWTGISKNGSIILRPYIYDNGPDYVRKVYSDILKGKKLVLPILAEKRLLVLSLIL
jgi:hypothetical protein